MLTRSGITVYCNTLLDLEKPGAGRARAIPRANESKIVQKTVCVTRGVLEAGFPGRPDFQYVHAGELIPKCGVETVITPSMWNEPLAHLGLILCEDDEEPECVLAE
jgi:hypothetical protein